MKNPEQIKKLAWERFDEAEILADNEKYDGAFYLLGYSIELMLKAKICEHLAVPNLFDEKFPKIEGLADVRKAAKTHDIATLFILSGLRLKFDDAKGNNQVLMKTNALLFDSSGKCTWSEQKRYQLSDTLDRDKNTKLTLKLILLLPDKEGLLKWIEKS
ncbi:MAG: hypothetical protein PHU14_03630 [Methylovulum sp.]|nr:hypothetical protein [Methylovulum sp.]